MAKVLSLTDATSLTEKLFIRLYGDEIVKALEHSDIQFAGIAKGPLLELISRVTGKSNPNSKKVTLVGATLIREEMITLNKPLFYGTYNILRKITPTDSVIQAFPEMLRSHISVTRNFTLSEEEDAALSDLVFAHQKEFDLLNQRVFELELLNRTS